MTEVNFKSILVILAVCLLGACSSSPSDSDIQKIADQGKAQISASMTPLGINFDELFDFQVKIVNKADQGNGRWLVQTETRMELKKTISDLPENEQARMMALTSTMGISKKGDKTAPQMSQVFLIKGEKGWIATN